MLITLDITDIESNDMLFKKINEIDERRLTKKQLSYISFVEAIYLIKNFKPNEMYGI